jgi:hypothetical protein
MTGRHRAIEEPRLDDPDRLLGALAAEPLDHKVAQAIGDLTRSRLRGLDVARSVHRARSSATWYQDGGRQDSEVVAEDGAV